MPPIVQGAHCMLIDAMGPNLMQTMALPRSLAIAKPIFHAPKLNGVWVAATPNVHGIIQYCQYCCIAPCGWLCQMRFGACSMCACLDSIPTSSSMPNMLHGNIMPPAHFQEIGSFHPQPNNLLTMTHLANNHMGHLQAHAHGSEIHMCVAIGRERNETLKKN